MTVEAQAGAAEKPRLPNLSTRRRLLLGLTLRQRFALAMAALTALLLHLGHVESGRDVPLLWHLAEEAAVSAFGGVGAFAMLGRGEPPSERGRR